MSDMQGNPDLVGEHDVMFMVHTSEKMMQA